MAEALRAEIAGSVAAVRSQLPLVLGISGTATQGLVADGLLAAGARPMLTATPDESPTLASAARALLVNVGSLASDARASAVPTARAAAAHGIPWVLDPAAIGLAPVRTPLAAELLALGPDAVRGNASEVLTLHLGSEAGQSGRGADSTVGPDTAVDSARDLAVAQGCIVAVSGQVDAITDGDVLVRVANGHPWLAQVSGTGCLLGALTAAHLGVRTGPGAARVSPFGAVVAATALLTVAAERAVASAKGPGSFRIGLLDALNAVSADEVATRVRLTWG
ncbi:hydroxyethylthiazole kinase [Knoellia sp. CPCC 206453]|uniref:hydroxyethylthiazole kinase n=1 Tax=Knoellia pratensis TaxID=3404796 RepID=UPI003613F4C3